MKFISIVCKLFILYFFLSISPDGFSETAATESGTVRIAVDEWTPYQTREAEYYGGAHRIITEAFSSEGVKVEYGWFPWKRALAYAREGMWDGAALSQNTPEREMHFWFSEPIMTVEKVFFHLKTYAFEWKDYDDLSDSIVGIPMGYVFGKAFQDARNAGKIRVAEVYDPFETNFNRLFEGKIQLFLTESDAGYNYLKNNFPSRYDLVTHHPKPVQVVTYHLILSKKIPKNEKMIKKFNTGLRKLKEAGKDRQYLLESLQGKYMKK